MKNIVQCLHRTYCGFYVFISSQTNFYIHILESRVYDKIFEIDDYFQNINVNVVFLLNNVLFIFKTQLHNCAVEDIYVLKYFICFIFKTPLKILYAYRCRIFFYVSICDSRFDKKFITCDYIQNININIVFLGSTEDHHAVFIFHRERGSQERWGSSQGGAKLGGFLSGRMDFGELKMSESDHTW